MNAVKILAPATIANLVCGFDVLGLALNQPADVMEVRLTQTPGITIRHTDGYQLPLAPAQNVAGAALQALLESIARPPGFEVIIDKRIKPGSGLGSSAASAAGVVVAANYLLGNIFNRQQLVRFAMAGEKLACGVEHADNIAPCIYGNICLVRSLQPLDVVELSAPPLYVSIAHPQIEIKTADARQMLRKEVPLKSAIQQWGNIAALVAGLLKNDYALISRSLEDVIAEPVRNILIPGFQQIKTHSKNAGALGGGIAGSGPSVFMLSRQECTANTVAYIMAEVFASAGVDFKTYVTTLNNEGVKLLCSS